MKLYLLLSGGIVQSRLLTNECFFLCLLYSDVLRVIIDICLDTYRSKGSRRDLFQMH